VRVSEPRKLYQGPPIMPMSLSSLSKYFFTLTYILNKMDSWYTGVLGWNQSSEEDKPKNLNYF